MDIDQRRDMRCGWIPTREFTGGNALTPPDYPHEYPTVCSGYLASLPQVIEAARARSWRREGALGQFYDVSLTPLAKDAIDIIDAECKSVEQHAIRKTRSK